MKPDITEAWAIICKLLSREDDWEQSRELGIYRWAELFPAIAHANLWLVPRGEVWESSAYLSDTLPLRVLLWGYHSYGYKLFVDIDSEGLDGLTAKLSELLILNQE